MGVGHEPVLVKEVLEGLNVKKDRAYIDATVGAGGHSRAICALGGRILGLDRDPTALELAKQNLLAPVPGGTGQACPGSVLVNAKFSQIAEVAHQHGFDVVDGVLFDLGVSSMQLDALGRGFSFMRDEQLDMRMDSTEEVLTAQDLVNALREDQLYDLFLKTSQTNMARAAARAIVYARKVKRIKNTGELARIVEQAVGGRKRHIHPATTIFMALRMIVNNEIEELENGLRGAVEVLKTGGRLAVISFHSGEDKIVKEFMKVRSDFKMITKKPVVPSDDEIRDNPRSRSAKLRVIEKQ